MSTLSKLLEGSCLCGGVKFEVSQIVGPFELCHCSRCRKVSGSAYMAGVYVKRNGFRFLQGLELIKSYEAPIVAKPPAYRICFCGTCGSPVPDPVGEAAVLEIPAGTLDGDPGIKPDKHIFIERKAPWDEIKDGLPQFDKVTLHELRKQQN